MLHASGVTSSPVLYNSHLDCQLIQGRKVSRNDLSLLGTCILMKGKYLERMPFSERHKAALIISRARLSVLPQPERSLLSFSVAWNPP